MLEIKDGKKILTTPVSDEDLKDIHIGDIVYLNGKELVEQVYEESRIIASETEKEAFYKRYIKTLSLKCNEDGSFQIVLKR